MSCGNPSVEQDALMPRRKIGKHTKMCVKCKEPTGRVFIRHAIYCKECFFSHVVQKSRRCLDPHINSAPSLASSSTSTSTDTRPKTKRTTVLKAPGNLVLGFSGGLGSTVLLDYIDKWYFQSLRQSGDAGAELKGGKDHPRNNSKVWEEAYVCHVDMSGLDERMKDRTEELRTLVDGYPAFRFVPVKIEDAFDPQWWGKTTGSSTLPPDINIVDQDLKLSSSSTHEISSPLASLKAHLASLPTPTAVQTTLQQLIRLLLLYTSRSLDASHLLLGTSLTSLSVGLITSISVGGGYVVREEAEEQWTPNTLSGADDAREKSPTIKVLRPLRDIGMKECAIWAWWLGLRVIGKDTTPLSGQSIGRLTKDFIVGLEKDYPSTVSAIARTCGKLAPKGERRGQCVLCERPTPGGVQDWKERISIRSFDPPPAGFTSVTTDPLASLAPHLCYVCHTTLTSRSSRSLTLSALTSAGTSSMPGIELPLWSRDTLASMEAMAVANQKLERGTPSETSVLEGEILETKRLGQDEMKEKLHDFLLEEE